MVQHGGANWSTTQAMPSKSCCMFSPPLIGDSGMEWKSEGEEMNEWGGEGTNNNETNEHEGRWVEEKINMN